MRLWTLILAALLVARAPLATAGEVAGVSLPESTTADGTTLRLNGAGLRTRYFLKIYVIGLYVEHPTSDAGALLSADAVWQVQLHMVRALSSEQIATGIGEAFERNAGDRAPALRARLEQLKAMFPATEAGETIALTYAPGRGTAVTAHGKDLGTIPGKDFAEVLLSGWIGKKPVDESLKQALLRGGAA